MLDIESSIENSENKKKNKAIVVSFFCKKGSSMKEFKVNQSILVINVKNFVEKLQIEALHLFYCTQSKKKAIIDSQTFFPEIFKYSLITLITIPNPFQTQHTNKSEQDHLKVFLMNEFIIFLSRIFFKLIVLTLSSKKPFIQRLSIEI